jgi:hypothetical protein
MPLLLLAFQNAFQLALLPLYYYLYYCGMLLSAEPLFCICTYIVCCTHIRKITRAHTHTHTHKRTHTHTHSLTHSLSHTYTHTHMQETRIDEPFSPVPSGEVVLQHACSKALVKLGVKLGAKRY